MRPLASPIGSRYANEGQGPGPGHGQGRDKGKDTGREGAELRRAPVRPDGLIEVLLLLELGLGLHDLLLEVHDGHLPDLDLLERLHVFAACLCRLLRILLALALEGGDGAGLHLGLGPKALDLRLEVPLVVLGDAEQVDLLLRVVLHLQRGAGAARE